MIRKILLFVSVLVLLAFIVNLLYADLTIPLTPIQERITFELLTNGDFELDPNEDKIPDGWTAKNITLTKADKIKCDKVDELIAYSGSCAFMFKGNPGGTGSNIFQTLTDLSLFSDGSLLEFTAYLDPRSGLPGSTFGKMQVTFRDGNQQTIKLAIPFADTQAVDDYVAVTDNLTLTLNGSVVTKVKIKFTSNQTSGKFLVDAVTLKLFSQGLQLIPGDGGYGDHFGNAVALSGDSAVIGASMKADIEGAAYVFTRSGDRWFQQQKLLPDDLGSSDMFGAAVAIAEDTVMIASHRHNAAHGAVYVFTRTDNLWTQQQKLTASDGAATDHFGGTLSLVGNTLVSGAWGVGNNEGAVYIFTYDGNEWVEQQKLVASDGEDADEFGSALALAGDTLLIGAYGENARRGAVYVFTYDGSTWSEQQKLTASDSNMDDFFGVSLALQGDMALIGSPNRQGKGAVYVFTRTEGVWSEQTTITGSDSAAVADFGQVIALSGDQAIITDDNDNSGQGAAYIFSYNEGTWSEWRKITAQDGMTLDGFGQSAALEGDYALVGAPDDYVFGTTLQGSAWIYNLAQEFEPLPLPRQ